MPSEAELRLRERLSRLRSLRLPGARVSRELERLQEQLDRLRAEPTGEEIWRSVELARHEDRPYTLDYVERLLEDFVELHGDRVRADDPAIVAGLGRFAGRTVALVGATGSGKTSLVALLARLYDPSAGTVSVDGADLRSIDVRSLRRQVAFVADDSFLFSATVAENIAYARPDASEEEVRDAARRAGAEEFLDALPQGYETMIGERGYTLSGGQRQRVAIARALLKDPRILILDDATSSVDATTESRITRALNELTHGRTTFIIAHRLSTIALADEIVVLEEGRIVAHGTHEELLETSDLYREIAEKGLPDQVFLNRKPLEMEEAAGL
jgi:ATP-binding cassette subfamily B protein